MIDPHWVLEDLDPLIWRQLGHFFDPGQYIRAARPGERGLFVLHEQGTVQRIVDSSSGVRHDLALRHIADPLQCAQQLYASGEWERVHVINKAHLAQVSRTAQATPRHELTLDEYYHQVYQLLWGDPVGYVSVPAHPGHWHSWTYQHIKDLVSNLPFAPASLTLGVFADERWIIGLILVCDSGQIRKVTTFEALDIHNIAAGLSENTLTILWKQLVETIAPPAGILICSQEVFESWIQQEDKMQVLLNARQQKQAFWCWLGSLAELLDR